MLTFRNTNIIFLSILVCTIALDMFIQLPVAWYFIIPLAYSLILFYGCYHIGSNFFLQVICSAETTKKVIALSFDDGPVSSYTPALLKLLWDHRVKAAFFCIGHRITGNENLLRKMTDHGHLIGNHSYTHHFLFDLYSSQKMLAELRKTDQAIKMATGLLPKLFRPPYGVTNPNLRDAIIQGNYTPVGWNIRSMDTVIKKEDVLFNKVKKAIRPGAVILFHDTSKATLDMLPVLIRHLHASGYEIVRLDKLLKLKAYA